MKILISAIACNPFLGSESYFGWAAVKCLSKDHELWVMTSGRWRPDIERAQREGLISDNVHFHFFNEDRPWHPNRLKARIQSWIEYANFTRQSLEVAKTLHARENFDIVHHITYSTWRVASPLWQLGIPFILGPVAGNEEFPFRLFPILSPVGAAFELARKTSNVVSRLSPKVRQGIRGAAHVFAITEESEQLMKSIRGSDANVSRLSSGFYSPATVEEFSRQAANKDTTGPLRLYAAGNLGGQKCIALAFEGLAKAKKQGVSFIYQLGSGGPEIPHLKQLAADLGLKDDIIFGGSGSREEYLEILHRTHVYLLPSMRETVGLTMLEAMLAGCVPIVADMGGPKFTVSPECGYKIAVESRSQMTDDIARAIVEIDRNRSMIPEKGQKASQRIATYFSEEQYRTTINAVYQSVARDGARVAR